MKVLFYNDARALSAGGGDVVYLDALRRGLHDCGAQTDVTGDPSADLRDTDVVHVLNVNLHELTGHEALLRRAIESGRPSVFSPFYDLVEESGFVSSSEMRPLWRTIRACVGHAAGFAAWRLKHRLTAGARRRRAGQRRVFTLVDRVVAICDTEAGWIRSDFPDVPGLGDKLAVERVGTAPQARRDLKDEAGAFKTEHGLTEFLLQVSRLTPVKNQLNVLRALKDWPGDVVLIGDPGYPVYNAACREAAARRKGRTLFLGRIPDTSAAFSAARVHILASWRETTGMAALEAGLLGCRLVVSDRMPARELYPEAAVCDPGRPSAIKKAVEAAWAGPPPSEQWLDFWRRRSWRRVAEAFLGHYEDLIRAKTMSGKPPL